MTRNLHRRLTRLHNNLPLILLGLVIAAGGLYTVDRIASLGARLARVLL